MCMDGWSKWLCMVQSITGRGQERLKVRSRAVNGTFMIQNFFHICEKLLMDLTREFY